MAAVGIGLAANTISGDSVGLSAQPLSAGEALAPPAASRDDARAAQRKRRERAARKARPRGHVHGPAVDGVACATAHPLHDHR